MQVKIEIIEKVSLVAFERLSKAAQDLEKKIWTQERRTITQRRPEMPGQRDYETQSGCPEHLLGPEETNAARCKRDRHESGNEEESSRRFNEDRKPEWDAGQHHRPSSFVAIKEKYKGGHPECCKGHIRHGEAAIGNELRHAEEENRGQNASEPAG